MAPHVLKLSFYGGERSVLLFGCFITGQRSLLLFNTRLFVLQSHAGSLGEEKNFLTWPRVEPRFCGLPLRSLVTGSTELSLVNKANLVHNFSQYVYFISVHISGDYVPIIRRNNCIYVTLGTCNSLWMTVWYAGSALDRVISPDDGHIFARNVYRKEINVLRKIMHQFGFVYKIIQGCRSTKLDF